MYKTQITKVIAVDRLMKEYWLGVFGRNEIPQLHGRKKWGLIANAEPNWNTGSHWVLLYGSNEMNNDRPVAFFIDPLNKPLEFYGPEFALALSDFDVTTLNSAVQHKNSVLCGAYCLLFYYFLVRDIDLSNIVEMFCSDMIRNDVIVRRFFAECLYIVLLNKN